MLTPDATQPKKPEGLGKDTQPVPAQQGGPGCFAWGLLAVAGGAFTLLIAILAGGAGYINGQTQVEAFAQETQAAFVEEQLTTWIPRDVAAGNTVLLEARIEGLASLTPAPEQVAELIATGTQLALDTQPTTTPTVSPTPLPTATTEVVLTATPSPTAAPLPLSDDEPLFDIDALFAEAQAQMSSAEYADAVLTLEAITGLDETYRAAEVESMLFEAWRLQALRLLRSGNPADLAAGIRAANAAAAYGDIGELSYESYIAGLYLDAQSKESLNPLGAITVYSQIYSQSPGYLDVRSKLFNIRVELGDEYYEAFDFCPAVQQYQAALAVQPGAASIQQKLEAAQSSCSSGEAATPVPGTVGETDETGDGESGSSDAPAAPPTNAPIGQR